jgi:4-alpha-glucanotransferase
LPGPYGIGDLGQIAYAWVDALVRAKQTWWQILPLGPTGFSDSPYQSFSAFAGNQNMVSPDALVEDGLVSPDDLAGVHFPADHVDFGSVSAFKARLLDHAWANFQTGRAPVLQPLFEAFIREQASWLNDFALYMALKNVHQGASWREWPLDLIQRKPPALAAARQELASLVRRHQFRQFLFFRQWRALKQYANQKGIRLIGDIPIFVAGDSADVWAHPGLFELDTKGQPTVVAGVPPDYFSADGQLWGNPLYNWPALKRTGYAWWVARLRATLEQVDLIRLDHFRGFEAYWAIPAGLPNARRGQWIKGPGADLMETLRQALGSLPLIAEDLGLITPEVESLREQSHLPGMRVLQFAFGGETDNPYLPHNYRHNTVVYTGTHDNDTTRGWYAGLGSNEKAFLHRYLGRECTDVAWEFIRLAWSSVADYAIAPLQDVVNLGSEARMNSPGRPTGNWGWRLREDQLNVATLERLADLTELYGRWRAKR